MRFLDSVERLRAGLDYHMARHNVLTANLAHLDTPGYKPLDLNRGRVQGGFQSALHVEMQATQPAHLGGVAPSDANAPFATEQGPATGQVPRTWRVTQEGGTQIDGDGNGVSVDREAVKIATNHVRYDVIAQLTSSELAGLSWAANDGRSG